MALELCTFDMLPPEYPGFLRGFSAALFATSLCYPLDTMRCAQPSACVESVEWSTGEQLRCWCAPAAAGAQAAPQRP